MRKVYNPGKDCPAFTRWSDPERLTFCRGVIAFALEGTLVFRPLCPGWRNALSASEVNPRSFVEFLPLSWSRCTPRLVAVSRVEVYTPRRLITTPLLSYPDRPRWTASTRAKLLLVGARLY
jgi:hypothetical protein